MQVIEVGGEGGYCGGELKGTALPQKVPMYILIWRNRKMQVALILKELELG